MQNNEKCQNFPPAAGQKEENKAKTLIFQIPTKKFHIQEKQIKKHCSGVSLRIES